MLEFTVILPVYNEEDIIAQVVCDIKKVLNKPGYKYELIIVNDGSSDSTNTIISKFEDVKVVSHPYNLGYGAALKSGIKNAKYDTIVISDSDGTYPAKYIPELLKHISEYDMVVGARTGDRVEVPLLRIPAKRFLSLLANFLSGYSIPDLNSGLRVFKKYVALRFYTLLPSRFSFTTTLTLACHTNDYKVMYIPIDYHRRKTPSTIRPINDFLGFISLIIRVITYFKPLKVFSLISGTLFLLGLLLLLYSQFILGKFMDVTITVILLSSLQIFLFGLIADLVLKERLAEK